LEIPARMFWASEPLLKFAPMYALIIYLFGLLTAVGHKQDHGKHTDPEANKDKQHCLPDSPITVMSLPPTQTDEERAYEKKKKRRETIKFWGEIFGVIVLMVYAGFTIAIWRANKQAADAAKDTLQKTIDHFQIDERAWIEIDPIKPVPLVPRTKFVPRSVFQYPLYLRNVGKTMARDVVMKATVNGSSERLGNDASMMEATQDRYLLDKFKESGTERAVIVPANPIPKIIAPSVVAPVPYVLTGQEPQYFKNGGALYDYLVGRIDYVDQFNVSHWIKFCFFVANPRGELRSCKYGNDEDRNSERR